MRKYVVKDSEWFDIKSFRTYKEADAFRYSRGRSDWSIHPLDEYYY